ncbi:hypothetical protein VNI00_009498 [Paramarasmius palmivorus]|uniref:Uncharacterized protein n=1 Tax=Paramarasmius palmivorus TaxID=297713 RepID=A0AAW0CRV4_9AGAR
MPSVPLNSSNRSAVEEKAAETAVLSEDQNQPFTTSSQRPQGRSLYRQQPPKVQESQLANSQGSDGSLEIRPASSRDGFEELGENEHQLACSEWGVDLEEIFKDTAVKLPKDLLNLDRPDLEKWISEPFFSVKEQVAEVKASAKEDDENPAPHVPVDWSSIPEQEPIANSEQNYGSPPEVQLTAVFAYEEQPAGYDSAALDRAFSEDVSNEIGSNEGSSLKLDLFDDTLLAGDSMLAQWIKQPSNPGDQPEVEEDSSAESEVDSVSAGTERESQEDQLDFEVAKAIISALVQGKVLDASDSVATQQEGDSASSGDLDELASPGSLIQDTTDALDTDATAFLDSSEYAHYVARGQDVGASSVPVQSRAGSSLNRMKRGRGEDEEPSSTANKRNRLSSSEPQHSQPSPQHGTYFGALLLEDSTELLPSAESAEVHSPQNSDSNIVRGVVAVNAGHQTVATAAPQPAAVQVSNGQAGVLGPTNIIYHHQTYPKWSSTKYKNFNKYHLKSLAEENVIHLVNGRSPIPQRMLDMSILADPQEMRKLPRDDLCLTLVWIEEHKFGEIWRRPVHGFTFPGHEQYHHLFSAEKVLNTQNNTLLVPAGYKTWVVVGRQHGPSAICAMLNVPRKGADPFN